MATQLQVHAADGVLSFRWSCADYARFCTMRDVLRAAFDDQSGLRWDATERVWRLPTDQRALFRDWADTWFAPSEQAWTTGPREQTHAGGGRGGQGAGRSSGRGRTTGAGSSLEDAYATLCLTADASPELVQLAYRVLAKMRHPGHGGDDSSMARLTTAVAAIRAADQGQAHAGTTGSAA